MQSIKIMLLGIAIILLGIALGITGVDVFEVAMIIAVPIGLIITIVGLIKKDNTL